MQRTLPQSDVDLFTSVHTMRREARLWADRGRITERHAFACRQWIALFDDGRAKHEHAFREVDCHDLSTGGFSFLSPDIPEAERLCVRLGSDRNFVYLTAQMIHCSPVDTDGGPGFLIGCRFLERTTDEAPQVVEAVPA